MDEKPRNTLTDFIEENQKLLSSVVIFTGLSVFINQLPGALVQSDVELKLTLRLVSSSLCILAFLALFEVIRNSNKYPDSGLVKCFNFLLIPTFVGLVYVWFRTFQNGILGTAIVGVVSLFLLVP